LSRCLGGSRYWIFAQCAVQNRNLIVRQQKAFRAIVLRHQISRTDGNSQSPSLQTINLYCDNEATQRADLADEAAL
jgi:hypothetical protein